MIKKTINYWDLDGNPIAEDFHFHLNKVDLAELQVSQKEGMEEYLKRIVEAEDGRAILAAFKEIIALSVGKRSEDGKRFIKSPEITADFMESEALGELLMEFLQNENAAAEFVRGVFPANMSENVVVKEYTDEELLGMSDEEFAEVAGRDPRKMTQRHLVLSFERQNARRKLAS